MALSFENPEKTKVPLSWARIGLYGGIGGIIGGTVGALMGGKNKVVAGIAGFMIVGLIGAFVGYQTSKGATMITVNPDGTTSVSKI